MDFDYEYFMGDTSVGYFCHWCARHGELPVGSTWGEVDAAAEAHIRDEHGDAA